MEMKNGSQVLDKNFVSWPSNQRLDVGDLLTTEQRRQTNLILSCGVSTPVALIGFLGNLANLVILAKQGLGDSVNISLAALALGDLAYVIIVLSFSLMCFSPDTDPVVQNNKGQQYVPQAAMLRIAVARISSGIMALIAAERCLCVMVPLKVKRLVTFRCTTVAVIAIYIAVLVLFVPVLMMLEVKWFPADGNRTVALAVPTEFYIRNEHFLSTFSDLVISVVLPLSQISLVIVCTLLTVVRLKASSFWRQSMSQANAVSSRFRPAAQEELPSTDCQGSRGKNSRQVIVDEKTSKLSKLLITIAVIYIVCSTPGVIATLVRLFIPEFNLNRQ